MEGGRSLRLWALGGAALCIAGLVWWMARRPVSIEAAGTRLVDCAISGDAGCLFAYTSEWERQALDLDRGKMEAFVKEWYQPRFKSRPAGAVQFAGNPTSFGELSVSRKVSFAKGEDATVNLEVVRTDNGYIAPYIVGQLWLTAVLYPARAEGKDVYRGPAKKRLIAEAARVEGPKLEAMGIRGLILDRTVGFQSWSELARYYDERAVAHEERIAQAVGQSPTCR